MQGFRNLRPAPALCRLLRGPVQLACTLALTGGVLLWTGCSTTVQPHPFRTYFVPPPKRPAPLPDMAPLADPPSLGLYAFETPALTGTLPRIARPSDAEFLVKQAEDRFAAGKRAFEDGRVKDAQQKYIYLTDGENDRVHIIDRDSLELLTTFGEGGRQPGEFYGVHSIATDSKGNIYTGETYRGQRVQKFTYKGMAPVTKKDQGVVWPKTAKSSL